jgi:hypothetical protein
MIGSVPWDMTKLLHIDEAAALVGRSAGTIRAWIRRGLTAVRQGKRTLVRLGDVLRRAAAAAAEIAQQDVHGKVTARTCAQVSGVQHS